MIHLLEDAGGGRIRDAATKDLVSSREVVASYNAMLKSIADVALAMWPFLEAAHQTFVPGGHGKEADR